MKIENATQLLEEYPKISAKKHKLINISGDLIAVKESGRIERITEADIIGKNPQLRIKKSVLIDKGTEI